MREILRAEALAVRYPGQAVPVLVDFTISLACGSIVALLGPSGVGKSSLLRVLAGLSPPSAGRVLIKGVPLRAPHPDVAIVFQDPCLLPWLDLEGNVGFGLSLRSRKCRSNRERSARIEAAITTVGLSAARHLRPAQLSGGMASRAALARCLACRPEILLLDEPFAALDEITRADLQRLLADLVAESNLAALLVTHDIDEALLLADRVILIGGTPARILATWTVSLPRPRQEFLVDLSSLRLDILSHLRTSLRRH